MTPGEPAERTFGDWLRQRRLALDLTRQELAGNIGCSVAMLRKLESEERRPSKQMVERLAEVLNVPASDREAFRRLARGDPFARESGPFGAPPDATHTNRANAPASAARHNLPLHLTRFVGREQAIAQIRQRLATARLVTLTGAGGTGKTRLALEVAASLVNDFADGAWLVELAPLTDPALVPQALGAALALREAPGRPMRAVLLEHLMSRQLLLVLDSCEHLVAGCAEMAEALLRTCPRLTVLATSREPLGIPGEIHLVVSPLSSPGERGPADVEALAQFEAVQLFADRAALALPGFQLTPANARGVARLCHQLDGLPLAIELAAARVKLLTVDQIADRLGDRFQLLAGANRRAVARHQTLAAMLDWSFELLSEPERVLLCRLAIFRKGWTLKAAERVAGGDYGAEGVAPEPIDVLELLTLLVNKSMVVVEHQPHDEPRYRLLETIRQYAVAKLAARGELEAAQRQHAAYFLELAEANRIHKAQAFFDWSARLDQEHDNLRAALAWGQSSPLGAGLFLRLAGELWSFWQHHGYWSEARAWQTAALAMPGLVGPEYAPARARVLAGLGIMKESQGDTAGGLTHLADSLALFQALQDTWWQANVLHWLGWGYREQADADAAWKQLDQSLALFRRLNDQVWMGRVLNTLGSVEIIRENHEPATAVLEEGLALNRAVGDRGNVGWSLHYLGHAAQLEGNFQRAEQQHARALEIFRDLGLGFGAACAQHGLGETALAQGAAEPATAHLTEALNLFRELGDRAGEAWCLAGLAGAAVLDETPARAARLWGAAEALRRSIGARSAPAARSTQERLMATARTHLGETAFQSAWTEGRAMPSEQVISLAQG